MSDPNDRSTDLHDDASGLGPDGGDSSGAPLSLEARLRRLDVIVARLEGGEVELEEGLALFEEGVRHIREAENLLSRAELKVEELIGEAGALDVQAFHGGDE